MMRSLRIGLVSQSYYPVLGGVTEHVHGLAKALCELGHTVTIVTGKNEARKTNPECLITEEAEREIRSCGAEILRVGRTHRLRWNGATVALVGGSRLGWDLRAIPRDRFDILHLHSPLEPILPLLAARHFDAPRVATFHSAGRTDSGYRFLRAAFAPLCASLSIRIAVSTAARDFVAGVFPGTYRIVPNGVNLSRFRARRDLVAPTRRTENRRTRILYVGRLDPRKGLETLLAALALLDRATWELDLVGSGPLAPRLEKWARRSNFPVRFHGAIGVQDLARFYEAADLAVAPAEYGESFGVCLLEAMAAGVPVIASDLAGYREVLQSRGEGTRSEDAALAALLVPPHDADAWASALRLVLSDAELRGDLAARGSKRVQRFDWSIVAAEVESCYEEMLWPKYLSLPVHPSQAELGASGNRVLDEYVGVLEHSNQACEGESVRVD